MSFTAKCLPVTFALSADKYLAASCCLEGVGGSQSRLGVFDNFGKVGVSFPSRLTLRLRSLSVALGGRRGIHAVDSPEPVWADPSTPLGHP